MLLICVVVLPVDKELAYFTASIAHKSDSRSQGVALVKRPTFTQREFIFHPYALSGTERFLLKSRR